MVLLYCYDLAQSMTSEGTQQIWEEPEIKFISALCPLFKGPYRVATVLPGRAVAE